MLFRESELPFSSGVELGQQRGSASLLLLLLLEQLGGGTDLLEMRPVVRDSKLLQGDRSIKEGSSGPQ